MVTLQSAENALKNVYLGVISNQLNLVANPLLSMIKHSTSNIYGKEIRKAAPVGINGGFAAGAEDGKLPDPRSTKYVQFVAELKNLYGQLEISDKAIRATSNNITSFVNLLNDEMQRLIEAGNFNLGRMIYGMGSGEVFSVTEINESEKSLVVDIPGNVVEGMPLILRGYDGTFSDDAGVYMVEYVDKANAKVYLDKANFSSYKIGAGTKAYIPNSKDKEITGIEALFSINSYYGLNKTDYKWLNPYKRNSGKVYISDTLIQEGIDAVEMTSGSRINYIATDVGTKRVYQEYLSAYRRNVDIAELAGGYKTITYNGIPVVGEKHVKSGVMYLLNTNDFTMYQLCDWKWLEDESGRILRQNPGYATYTATLVKYCELLCERPCGQGKIMQIAKTLTPPSDDSSGSDA